MKCITAHLAAMAMCCLLYSISAVVLLSAYFDTEKLTSLGQDLVQEARLFVAIASAIHFILAIISFFTTCSAARLQQEYVYGNDKWFNELWLMLDMDHDQRYLTRRREDLEGGDFDEESRSPPIDLHREGVTAQDKFYPIRVAETEDIIAIIPETTMNEFLELMHKGEIQAARGNDSDFTLANALKILQSSELGTLRFPTDTKLRKAKSNSKLQEMKTSMERSASRLVEGIQVSTNATIAVQPLPSKLATKKPGEEHTTLTETLEKELDEAIDLEEIAHGNLEFISEKLGLGRL